MECPSAQESCAPLNMPSLNDLALLNGCLSTAAKLSCPIRHEIKKYYFQPLSSMFSAVVHPSRQPLVWPQTKTEWLWSRGKWYFTFWSYLSAFLCLFSLVLPPLFLSHPVAPLLFRQAEAEPVPSVALVQHPSSPPHLRPN